MSFDSETPADAPAEQRRGRHSHAAEGAHRGPSQIAPPSAIP